MRSNVKKDTFSFHDILYFFQEVHEPRELEEISFKPWMHILVPFHSTLDLKSNLFFILNIMKDKYPVGNLVLSPSPNRGDGGGGRHLSHINAFWLILWLRVPSWPNN